DRLRTALARADRRESVVRIRERRLAKMPRPFPCQIGRHHWLRREHRFEGFSAIVEDCTDCPRSRLIWSPATVDVRLANRFLSYQRHMRSPDK
ncbi:hypothetical protein ACYOEI_13155, partial [Singulisphaera rosea]